MPPNEKNLTVLLKMRYKNEAVIKKLRKQPFLDPLKKHFHFIPHFGSATKNFLERK